MQLIRADNDAHLWAQSYDRQLTDIFGVEAEVAKSIADSLQATLSPQEKARVETKPTSNADAYVLYLRGRDYQTRPDNLLQDFQTAINFYDQAIKLDPEVRSCACAALGNRQRHVPFLRTDRERGSKRRMRRRWNRCDSNRTSAKATSRLGFTITTSKAITMQRCAN